MQSNLRRAVLALLALTALAEFAPAQVPDAAANRRTISVSGTGSVRVKPDLAMATVGLSRTSPKLPDAKAAVDAGIAKLRAALRKEGVAELDIQSVQYQIYRVQANPQAGIRESGWKVVHMLQARTKKPETIAGIVDAAVEAGATDIQGIMFTVDQLAPHRVKARELAVQAAKDKAQQLAKLLGVTVGDVFSVSELAGDYYPAQIAMNARFDMGGAGGGSDISGGQVEVSTAVQVVFSIR